jgi:hypothetical protein
MKNSFARDHGRQFSIFYKLFAMSYNSYKKFLIKETLADTGNGRRPVKQHIIGGCINIKNYCSMKT